MDSIPEHIPIKLESLADISNLEESLGNRGYKWTLLQIIKPGQIFGMVKEIEYRNQVVDHHIRCYSNGVITSEIELRRVQDLWLHLTSHSISAHEYVIKILEQEDLEYHCDEDLRRLFQLYGPTEFVRDYLEFFRWLFYGVLFWTPLGYLWKLFQAINPNSGGFTDHIDPTKSSGD